MRYRALLIDARMCDEASGESASRSPVFFDIAGQLGTYDIELRRLDCNNPVAFRAAVQLTGKADFIVLDADAFSAVQRATAIIRESWDDVPIILAGSYALLEHDHAVAHADADCICRKTDAGSLLFALKTFGFKLKSRMKQRRSPLPEMLSP